MSAEEKSLFLNIMIKHLRKYYGLTQQQLADKLSCKQREVWRYEQPGYKVSPKVLYQLSSIFNCSMDVIFGNTQHPAKFKALDEFKKLKTSDTWI